jgi:uroporphyrinogen decarboxylase
MAAMTHRERVLAALNHREPDRVPIDLGSTRCSSIHVAGYQNLKKHFGIEAPDTIIDGIMRPVAVDERILQALDIDTRGLFVGAAENSRNRQVDETTWLDEWGVTRVMPPGSLYYDLAKSPLAGEITIQDVVNYPWPDPDDPGRYRGLRERAEALRRSSDHAIVFNMASGAVHITQYLRGFQEWFTDLVLDPKLSGALLDAVIEFNCAVVDKALGMVSDLIDVVFTGDDVGHHNSPLMRPEMYRELVKPRHKRYFDTVRKHTNAPILYHTCGDVYPLMGDLVDIGITALNPVQITAAEMDPVRLKAEWGDKMAFWGGVDSHRVLPWGTIDEVKQEVELRIKQMGHGGGYVVNSVHNLQPDVAPEKIVAMFEHAREFGRYPLPS